MVRRKRRRAEPPAEVELPVTPMLDMAFQLLAFFVFAYHPPSAEEGQIPMTFAGEKVVHKNEQQASITDKGEKGIVPVKKVTLEIKANPVKDRKTQRDVTQVSQILIHGIPREVKAKLRDDPTLKADADLKVSQIDPGLESLDVPPPYLKNLETLLARARPDLMEEAKRKITFEPNSQLRVEQVMELMDVCRKAGFENIVYGVPSELSESLR